MAEVLTVRDCADWMGMSADWVHRAIKTGVMAADGTTVQLEAELVPSGQRRIPRIYRDDFVTFLTAIGWTKIPRARGNGHPPIDSQAPC